MPGLRLSLVRVAFATSIAVLATSLAPSAAVLAAQTSDVTSKPTRVSKAKAKKAKPKAKRSKRSKARSRRASKRTKPANMPKGWAWPPTREMEAAGKACLAKLDTLGVGWKKAKQVGRITTPITVPSMEFGGIQYTPTYKKPPFTMDCHLALSLANSGTALTSSGVTEVRFSRLYGNTKVRSYGRTGKALSRHALGLAIDLREFVTVDGTIVNIFRDYPSQDEVLLTVEKELTDTGGFRSLLTPGNDPKSHSDHYHVEAKLEYPAPSKRKRKSS